jgi:predicted permease
MALYVLHPLPGDPTMPTLRQILRPLAKSPGFAFAVLLTLALSIGANSAIFSVVNALLLRPLPYPHPDRLATVELTSSRGVLDPREHIDGATWLAVRDHVPAVEPAVSSLGGLDSGLNLQFGRIHRYVPAARVSASFFPVLGIPPALGRTFTAAEDLPGGPAAAILSHDLFRTLFDNNPAILGHAILIKGVPTPIVGVLPQRATIPGASQVYTPIRPSRIGEGGGTNYSLFVRLRPGASWPQANAQLASIPLPSWMRAQYGPTAHYQFIPLQKGLGSAERTPALVLLLATGLILLIACANLAGLALIRITRRTSEIATRLALGASPSLILRQLWLENLALALLGGLAGLSVATLTLRGLLTMLPPDFRPLGGLHLDLRVLLFTLAVALCASLLFGMLPALRARTVDIRSALGSGGYSVLRSDPARHFLIAGEVALTVLLLAAAGLLLRTLVYLETLPPGFDPHGVLIAKASLDDARFHDPAAFEKLITESTAAMARIPGVQSAAVGLSVPYERALNDYAQVADGPDAGHGDASETAWITPAYFQTLGIRLLAGRAFTPSDTSTSEPVAIVNAAFTRQMLHGANPIGRHLQFGKRTARIVGEVNDIEATPGLEPSAPLMAERAVYIPYTQLDSKGLALIHIWFQPDWIVRAAPIPNLAGQMQSALASADPNLPLSGFFRMTDLLRKALAQQRLEVALLSTLAALALLLSALGIYALVSAAVTQRRREIGLRLALGATLPRAMREVGRAGLLAALAGLAAGLALSFLALPVLRSALFGVRAYDPATLAATVLILLVIALLATFVPTLRIAAINPAETLRSE